MLPGNNGLADARKAAYCESKRIAHQIRMLQASRYRQNRREAEVEVRARFWAARGLQRAR